MNTYSYLDMHGKNSIPSMAGLIPRNRWKEIKVASWQLAPRSKNGLNDCYTYYHVLDGLLNAIADETFRTREFTEYLEPRPLEFDTITVGRVIADISESLDMANGRRSIISTRQWNGVRHSVSAQPEDRRAMENLLEDLFLLCKAPAKKRHESPLYECASVAVPTQNDDSMVP